jgi:uncharacterized hydrophobic protein (TIGR00271 family)
MRAFRNNTEERRVAGIIVRLTPERRQEIFDEVKTLSTATPAFFIMVVISTIIASYGLLANSTAVIIGAMLVAPLMGPIFGVALALTVGDSKLLGRSLLSELAGMLLVIIIALIIGLVPIRLGFGSEIIARTQPTVYDLLIALASGIAGAYAMVDERLNATLPGVAMAVALLPPLATCGLSLAAMRWHWALGSLLLFLANFLSIHVVAAAVFGIFGVKNIRVHQDLTLPRFFRRFSLSLLALAVVAVFLTQTLISLWDQWHFTNQVQQVLTYEVRLRSGAQLSDIKRNKRDNHIEVLATVLTPNPFEPHEVAQIEKVLRQQVDPRIHLILRSLISQDYDPKGPVYLPKEEIERRAKVAESSAFLTKVSQSLNDQLKKFPGAHIAELDLDPQKNRMGIVAVARTPVVIGPAQVAEMEKALQQAIGQPIHLVVRSILTSSANSHQYLYETIKPPEQLAGAALKFYQQLEKALKEQFRLTQEGTHIEEFRYAKHNGRLLLLVVVRTPQNITAAQVSQIQQVLRHQVDPNLDLVVRSLVGVDTTETGYVPDFDERQLLPQTEGGPVPK